MIKQLLVAVISVVFISVAHAQYKPTPGEQKLLRSAELREAEQQGKIMSGMDRATVVRILGSPTTINASKKGAITTEQMIYRVKVNCGGRFDEYSMNVYLTDDIVTSHDENLRCSR